jgi:hypothetical protein
MTDPEIKQFKKDLLLTTLRLSVTALSEATGEPRDAVSCVVNDIRPRNKTRVKVADEIAKQVYELFDVDPPARKV